MEQAKLTFQEIESALNVTNASYTDVLSLANELDPLVTNSLSSEGLYIWIKEDDLGHQTTRRIKYDENATFIISNMIIDGIVRSSSIIGNYNINGDKISIQVKRESSNLATIYVFLNGDIMATKIDPLSEVDATANAFMVSVGVEDTEEKLALAERRNPSRLAFKMLNDLKTSEVNKASLDELSEYMKNQGWIVKYSSEL